MSKKKKSPKRASEPPALKQTNLFYPISLLVLACLIVFWPARTHDFVALDDNVYVSENPMVIQGLTWKSVTWACTTFHQANWHPLTWLSHMVDSQLYGMNAGRHLLTNAALHAFASVFLFLALTRMTRRRSLSLIVAGLFAIHPLHVESVAWLAERKDVLSAAFCMLALWFYSKYASEGGSRKYYGAVLVCFALGLLAKPMLVTLPCLLLLLDYWPLGRLNAAALKEKIPLFVLTAASSVITFIAQSRGGAVQSIQKYPLDVRIWNSAVSTMQYLHKMLWPVDLAVFYPYTPISPLWALLILLLLVLITVAVFLLREKHPWLLTGWLWYCVSLAPVIGIIQVGDQAMADRYTYIPLIGIFISLVWEVDFVVKNKPVLQRLAAGTACAVVVVLIFLAHHQVGFWKNSGTLFVHTLAVTGDNPVIENNYGTVLAEQGRTDEALIHFENSVRLRPDYVDARMNLGLLLANQGKTAEAIAQYDEALKSNPRNATVYFNRGVVLLNQEKLEPALESFEEAIRLDPQYTKAHLNAGVILARTQQLPEAIEHFQQAIRLEPASAETHANLGQALAASKRYREAEQEFETADRIQPGNPNVERNLTLLRQILQSR